MHQIVKSIAKEYYGNNRESLEEKATKKKKIIQYK